MASKRIFLGLSIAIVTTLQGFGWGQKGHDTVAFIAESHLTPTTLHMVDSILGNRSIVYYSNWLDNASHTPEYAYTKTWHYKNIDPDETFENAPVLKTGDVVTAIREQVKILSDPKSKEDKSLALKILIHLVGDIHQPMHMGRRQDRGGNAVRVKYFYNNSNLHSIWDTKILESGHNWTYTEWKNQIDRAIADEVVAILSDGTPEKWGKETYLIAKDIYETTPAESELSFDYIAKWTPVIENQLLKGGLRLADLLNSIYDEEYKSFNSLIVK